MVETGAARLVVDTTTAVGMDADVADEKSEFVLGAEPNTRLVVAVAESAVYVMLTLPTALPRPHRVKQEPSAEIENVVVEPVILHA